MPVFGQEPVAVPGRMDAGQKVRPAGEQAVVVDERQPFGRRDLPDGRIDVAFDAARRLRREGEGSRLRNGRDGRQKYAGRLSAPVLEAAEGGNDLSHIGGKGVRGRAVDVGPDVVRAELEEDEIGPLGCQLFLVGFEEAQVFSRRVSFPAVVEHPGPDAVLLENLLEKMGISLGGDAVAGAEDDDALGRRGADRDEERQKKEDGTAADADDHFAHYSAGAAGGQERRPAARLEKAVDNPIGTPYNASSVIH